jgi:CRP-like cAMP-binding protein
MEGLMLIQHVSDSGWINSAAVRSSNHLLGALPSPDYERIARQLKPRRLQPRDLLQKQDEPIGEVLFFNEGACSLVKVMRDGQTAEIASIGNEGAVGAWAFFGEDRALGDTIVHRCPAAVESLAIEAFQEEMARRAAFCNLIVRYSQALTAQLMQTTVCNGLHSAEARTCRWLLMTQDRLGRHEFPVTHDFVASMLGVRRPTVTLILAALLKSGIIEYRRGFLRISNRHALEHASCECYEQIVRSFRRLLPEVGELRFIAKA